MRVVHKWIENNILIEIQDNLNFQALLEANAFIISSPKFDYMSYQIFDFLKVKNIEITHQDVKTFSMLQKNAMRWNDSVKVALIAVNPQIINDFKIYIADMEVVGSKCKLFENIDDALEWCLE